MGIFSGSLDCDCCEEEGPPPPPPPSAVSIGAARTWWYMNDAFTLFQQGKPGIDHRQFTIQTPLKNDLFQSKLFPPDGAGRVTFPGYLNPDTHFFTPDRNLNWVEKPCMELCGAATCSLPQQPPYNFVNCGTAVGGNRILKSSTTSLVEAQFTYLDPGFFWGYNAAGPGPVGGPGSLSNTGSIIFVQNRAGTANVLTGGAAPPNQSPLNSENNRAGIRYGFEWDKTPQPSKTLWDIMAPSGKTHCRLQTKVWYWFGIAVASPNAYKLYADDFGGSRDGVTMNFKVGFAGIIGSTDLDIARKLHIPSSAPTDLWSYERSLSLPSTAACVGYLGPGNQKLIDYGPGQVSDINTTTGVDIDVDITPLLKGTNISSQVLGFYFVIQPAFTSATTTWGFLRTDIWGQSQITPSNPNGVGRSFGYSSAVAAYTDNNWQLVYS